MSKFEKIKEMDLVSVDNARIKQVIDTYFHWKQLDAEIKTLSGTRGINFPSELSEYMACYALGLLVNKEGSSGDATIGRIQHIWLSESIIFTSCKERNKKCMDDILSNHVWLIKKHIY